MQAGLVISPRSCRLMVSLLLIPVATSVSWADVVLQDDFNDGVLDPAKWWTNTTPPYSAVFERYPEGDIESMNRGYLNSLGQWRPGSGEAPVVIISGRFQLPNEGETLGDMAQISTRSSGAPRPGARDCIPPYR